MTHAFLIQSHTSPELLLDLVNQLDATSHYFYIHIDRRSQAMLGSEEIKQLKSRTNCKVISIFRVNWGGQSQILATLATMRIALADGHTWYHLISGQDYPIRGNDDIDRFFADTQYKAFLSFVPETQYAEIEEMRLNRYHLCDAFNLRHNPLGKVCSRISGKLQDCARRFGIRLRHPLNMKVYKGATWFSFNNEVVRYIVSYLSLHPAYERRYRYTSCCDEVFFHTLLMNSPLASSVYPDDLRYIRWESKSSPEWLDERDFAPILASQKLFCRKIHPEISKTLIGKLKCNGQPQDFNNSAGVQGGSIPTSMP